MNAFLQAIWNFYIGMLTLIGNAVLITAGFLMTAYATYGQLQEKRDTQLNAILLVVGLLLIVSSTIRRFVWTLSLLLLLWGGMIYALATAQAPPNEEPKLTMRLASLMGGPPLLFTIILMVCRRPSGTRLEISVGEKLPD